MKANARAVAMSMNRRSMPFVIAFFLSLFGDQLCQLMHGSSQEIIDKGISWARNYARISYPVFQYSPMVTVAHWSEPFKGFSRLLGKEVIFKIEARAILEGLHQLEVESDNDLLIETIVKGGATDSQIMKLRRIHQMACRGWKVCFRHVPKTHNIVADHMAKVLATRFTEIQVFE
ncbi:hypothetical protein Godav_016751, partial [Gossypium davidsonii]|nr:hypothetical protein [Gossypium davidsonii]